MENTQPGTVIFTGISEGRLRLQVAPSAKAGGASQLLLEIARAQQKEGKLIVNWAGCQHIKLPGTDVARICAHYQDQERPEILASYETSKDKSTTLHIKPSQAPGVFAWRLVDKEYGDERNSVSIRFSKKVSQEVVTVLQAALPSLLGWGTTFGEKALETVEEDPSVQEAASQMVDEFFDKS